MGITMNTISKTILSLPHTVSTALTKISKRKLPQEFLFLLTGFLVSQFFLLNILHSQNPQGGWITPFGTVSTLSLITTVLLAIITCLVALWRSASKTEIATRKTETKSYSKPATFMSVSPE